MSLADKLKEIDHLKTKLDKLLPMSAEHERTFWKKIRLDWNFNSNNIEGNTLTYGETQLLLIFDKTTGDHELREYEEMKAHDAAIHLIKDWAKDKERDLFEKDIRELNKIILVKPYWKEAQTSDGQPTRREIKVGEYKEFPNSVRLKNGEIFEYASPSETPIKMANLMNWYKKSDMHPVILASQLHYDFIRIHPFDDGNGRVARLLVNYVLMKNGFPPIVIKTKDKENYLTALNKADVGDLEAFHEYVAEQVIASLKMTIRAAKGENIDDKGDLDKRLNLFEKNISKHSDYVSLKKSLDLQIEIGDKFFIPLVEKIDTQIEKFRKHFFNDYYDVVISDLREPGQYNLIKTKQLITSALKDNLSDGIRVVHSLSQFRKAENSFNVGMLIILKFEEFKYNVSMEIGLANNVRPLDKAFNVLANKKLNNIEKCLVENYYHIIPNLAEIDSLSETVGNILLSYIELQTNG
jgi:Fic family protein